MKANVKKECERKWKSVVEELAGPITNWVTTAERDAYIKGVMDGIKEVKSQKGGKSKEIRAK